MKEAGSLPPSVATYSRVVVVEARVVNASRKTRTDDCAMKVPIKPYGVMPAGC
jgi:hypothetical protein